MTRPLLLVDVDGVINAYGFTRKHPEPKVAVERTFEVNGADEHELAARYYTIKVPVGTMRRLRYLDSIFDCMWCTTWGRVAIRELAPVLGVGASWPVLKVSKEDPLLPDGRFAKTWKLPNVWRWIEANAPERRVAWIDDDLGADARRWAHEHKYLLITTQYQVGMTKDDVRVLRTFACGASMSLARPTGT